jgi:hypothetical protein
MRHIPDVSTRQGRCGVLVRSESPEWIRDVTDVVRADQAAAAMDTAVAWNCWVNPERRRRGVCEIGLVEAGRRRDRCRAAGGAWSAGIATVASKPLDQVPADGVLAVSGALMRQVR